jgi:hypothetical protein
MSEWLGEDLVESIKSVLPGLPHPQVSLLGELIVGGSGYCEESEQNSKRHLINYNIKLIRSLPLHLLSHEEVALLGVPLRHAQEPLIGLLEVLACLPDGVPHAPLVLSFQFLQGHLGAQVVQEEHEIFLDLLAQEVDVLGEGVLAVPLWEGPVAVVVPQAVSHVVQAGMRRQEVPRFIQEVPEVLHPRGEEGFHVVFEKLFFPLILQGVKQLNGRTKELEGLEIGHLYKRQRFSGSLH